MGGARASGLGGYRLLPKWAPGAPEQQVKAEKAKSLKGAIKGKNKQK